MLQAVRCGFEDGCLATLQNAACAFHLFAFGRLDEHMFLKGFPFPIPH